MDGWMGVHLYVCVSVCLRMCVCMYVCMYECMCACTYLWMCGRMDISADVLIDVCSDIDLYMSAGLSITHAPRKFCILNRFDASKPMARE